MITLLQAERADELLVQEYGEELSNFEKDVEIDREVIERVRDLLGGKSGSEFLEDFTLFLSYVEAGHGFEHSVLYYEEANDLPMAVMLIRDVAFGANNDGSNWDSTESISSNGSDIDDHIYDVWGHI